MLRRVALVAAVLSLAGSAAATTIIDTTVFWNGTDAVAPFGQPDTATYGQTITVGADTHLQDFTFYVDDDLAPVTFAGYVAAWNGFGADPQKESYLFVLFPLDALNTDLDLATGKRPLLQ